MDGQRAGTSHSQQAFIPMHYLEHSAPEVVQHPVHEKYQSPPPSRHGSIYPPAQKQGAYFTSPEFEAVPPQYPGAAYPAALVAPPIEYNQQGEERFCGLRRRLFLILLAVGGLVLLIIAIAVGVGVGLSSHNNNSSASAAPVLSASSTSRPAASPTAPIPTTTAAACLEATNNSQYSTSNGKTFLRLCNVDYSGVNEATDIGDLKASTFEKCIELCAAEAECTGAGWGPAVAGKKYRETCWMKKDLKRSHVTPDDWYFAILLAGTTANGTTPGSS
ncbi:hypothetical protein QBC34DRAFT_128952 [Podospora aff. communis PSN243]|uniref:Apple domain-containing protein n=1 Tax=Podospora aff. communis PSN243 TaxID=3040156 RepID=A0AAV9GG85_9PEZI|nr:hypothetical protein QBC34DRAFT_128952 [Podospora aff. communis PSN243]